MEINSLFLHPATITALHGWVQHHGKHGIHFAVGTRWLLFRYPANHRSADVSAHRCRMLPDATPPPPREMLPEAAECFFFVSACNSLPPMNPNRHVSKLERMAAVFDGNVPSLTSPHQNRSACCSADSSCASDCGLLLEGGGGGLRHPWHLSAFATAITTWLGALSRSCDSRRAHRRWGGGMPVRCNKKDKVRKTFISCSAGCCRIHAHLIALPDDTASARCQILAPGLAWTCVYSGKAVAAHTH